MPKGSSSRVGSVIASNGSASEHEHLVTFLRRDVDFCSPDRAEKSVPLRGAHRIADYCERSFRAMGTPLCCSDMTRGIAFLRTSVRRLEAARAPTRSLWLVLITIPTTGRRVQMTTLRR